MNIFEQASREKLRFEPPSGGVLMVEDLWGLPLTSKTGRANLDDMARGIHIELKEMTEVSFVETKPDPRKSELELKLEILKHVIATRIAERDAALQAADKAERKKKLLEALAAKQDAKLTGMSEDEIRAELANL